MTAALRLESVRRRPSPGAADSGSDEGNAVTRSLLRSVLVAGVAVTLVSGCGTPEAGSAATVGSRRISVQDVQSATADIQALYGPEQPVPQQSVLFLMAAAPYLETAAIKLQAGASIDDARTVFGTKVAHPSQAALQVIQANVIIANLQKLGNEQAGPALQEVTDSLQRDKLSVNPRYGTFDPQTGIKQVQPNWLPTPPPSATPAP